MQQPGLTKVVIPATVGNAVYTYTNGQKKSLHLLFGNTALVTDASVANRTMVIGIYDDSTIPLLAIDVNAGAVQAASLTRDYEFLPGIFRETAFVNGEIQMPIPTKAVVPAGWKIKISVTNGVVGDSFSGLLLLEEHYG